MQAIRTCSPETSTACDFQSLLVVQPFSKNNQNPQTWLLKLGESLEDETKFCTYVLTVICELDVESVSVRAIFDAAVLSLDKVNAMLEQLEYLLTRLVDSVKSQTLGEVMDMWKLGSSVHDECKVEQLNS
ncbi:nonribosomal brevianamide peptide synthase FtmA [Trichophyton rubrum]|nr:nonribosomal brevianamide peptide synthase FtmA [Trichophyton rubrum]